MKKRRVLALFLALSMAIGSNGFTALGAENSALTIETNSSEEADGNSEVGSSALDEEGGDETEAADYSGGDESGMPDENSADDAAAPDEGSGVSDEEAAAPEEGSETGAVIPGETDVPGTENGNNDGASGDGNGAETGMDASEPEEDIRNDASRSEDVQSMGVKMYSFTDETGMVVTYDLNAEAGYKYTVENGKLTKVTMSDGTTPLSGVVELKQQDGADKFDTIGAEVFKENAGIEYVILPDDVTAIQAGAFLGCTKLRGIKLPVSLAAIEAETFKGCTNMTQLSIPKGVQSIGSDAFNGDVSLFMVYIKDSTYSKMTSIGSSAFKGCRRLEKFGSDTEFVFPGYLETIGASAFEDCRAIKKFTLPDSVKEKKIELTNPSTGEIITATQPALGESVFRGCIGLTDVTLSGAAVIPKYAFYDCASLLSITFVNGNKKVDEHAFENCSRLGEVRFTYTVDEIGSYAFSGCGNLRYVEIPNAGATLGDTGALPNNHELWLCGFKGSNVEVYARERENIKFIEYNGTTSEYFLYDYKCLTDVTGKVTFTCADKETDPNAKNNKKGVKAGEKIYVFVTTSSSVKLVEGSLRCNGTPIGKEDGEYTFNMPVGGAYVTAEFERTGKDENQNIVGSADDVKCELSNGNQLKVGQTSRMFLIDTSAGADNSIIEYSKITFETSDKAVATVSDNGTIKALKKGKAYITAYVTDRNGNRAHVEELITVEESDVYSLRLKPFSYDTSTMTLEKNSADEILGISLNKASVESKETSFILLATAYDKYEDNMSVALQWKTSDSKVAKIEKSSTKDAESQNTITIPAGASGEATIMATATNAKPEDPDNKKVVCKFVIRVMDSTPRLAASSLTLNPYQENGTALEIISAYGAKINKDNVSIRRFDDKELLSREFRISYDETGDTGSSIVRFRVNSVNTDIKDGSYKEYICVRIGDNTYYLDLNITVKRSTPNPKVKFAKSQEKINLFYKDDGTQVIPEISGLGNAKIIKYSLENLSQSGDDTKFTDNFAIDEETGVITRSYDEIKYDSKKKPVVTGYLVLKFEGYREGVNERRYKVTIPTKTAKPSYKLERASDTFNPITGRQEVTLALLDSKTKEAIVMDDGWTVEKDVTSSSSAVDSSTVEVGSDGMIRMEVNPNGSAGKVVLAVYHDSWDEGQVLKYNYTVKISSKKPTFKFSKASVTLNRYFVNSQVEEVELKANQYGVEPIYTEPQLPAKLDASKLAQYNKINVGWDSNKNAVTVSLAESDIKNGSYKYTFMPLGEEGNKVTLTVKVTGASPNVSLKGSAKLNVSAGSNVDVAELAMNIKNLPSNCELDADGTTGSIECVTNRGVEDSFNWEIEDNKLKISLSDTGIAAKAYTFTMTPTYTGYSLGENDKAKQVKFKVTLYRKSISVTLKAKGKLNLLERYEDINASMSANAASVNAMADTSNYNSAAKSYAAYGLDTAEYSADDDSGYAAVKKLTEQNENGDVADTPTDGTGDADVTEGYTVTYKKNGSHAVIKNGEGAVMADAGSDKAVIGADYTFAVETENEYAAEVKVYTTESYNNTAGPEAAEPQTVECTKTDAGAYKIDAANLKGDITVVVTDIYTVTINDNTGGVATELKYKTDGPDYAAYDNTVKPTAAYGQTLSFKFAKAPGKRIAAVDEKGNMLKSAPDAAETEPVYVIDKVEDNTVITLWPVYTFTETITKDSKNNNTAAVEYSGSVIAGESAYELLPDKDLTFKVTPVNEYKIDKVEYKLKTASETVLLTALPSGEGEAAVDYCRYAIAKADITDDFEIIVTTKALSQVVERPEYKYTLKNSIVYTPVVSNLKDTVVEAQIYDAQGREPSYNDNQSNYFNIDVVDGLLYVTPKEDWDEDIYLKNNTTYPVKIWLKFSRYDSGEEDNNGGLWVSQIINIKTAQILPKVTTDENEINLYQSNTGYAASFVVRLKEGSTGEIEDIEFGEKDETAKESFELSSELQRDGSLKVYIKLNGTSLYASNSSNKVKMYVRFRNQAKDTLGTAITMNVKINK